MDPATRTAERRAVVRHLCDPAATALLREGHSGPSLWAQVRDASAAGLGLLVSRRVTPGSFVGIELRSAGSRYPTVLCARVAHATLRPDGAWHVGCALLDELPRDVLAALASGRKSPPAAGEVQGRRRPLPLP